MSDKITRSRAPNFTKEEQLLLFSAMEPYTKIIECKKTDSTKQIDKQNAWTKVSDVYNANTKGVKRSTENLISCYRNVKSKLKKQHSEAKMLLVDPNKKEALLNAFEEHGQDWADISSSINTPIDVCQSSFKELQKIAQKDDTLHKKQVLGTGGGPPPSQKDPFMAIKKFIEPQMDGMYTIYDGDAELMDEFQKTKSAEEQVQPIEVVFLGMNKENMIPGHSASTSTAPIQPKIESRTSNLCADNSQGSNMTPQAMQMQTPSRTDFLRKKRAPELVNDNECPSKKKRNVNDSFFQLSQEKLELVQMQKKIMEMEMNHKIKLYSLEIEDKIDENKFRSEQRQKELYLLELKIKKESH